MAEVEKKDNIIKFKNGKNKLNLLYAVIALFIVAYFVFLVFKINYEPVKTEVCLQKTVSSAELADAFIVRDEYPVEASDSEGTLVPLVEDGKRVASGDAVAVVFDNEESAKVYNEIQSVKEEIEYYSSLENRVGVQTADITPLDERIYSACEEYVVSVNKGNVSDYGEKEKNIRNAITSRQLATGSVIDPSEKLGELNSKLSELESKKLGYNTIEAPHPGYYISLADGYENAVNYNDVLSLSTAQIQELINSEPEKANDDKYMGKLSDGFNWYILCVIDYDNAVKLKVGDSVKIEFTMAAAEPLKAKVALIGENVDGKSAVVFKSNLMNREYSSLRKEQIRITFSEYDGLQVSNKAIREIDGQKGVYVQSGNIVEFKKINILYSDSDISICNNPDNKSGFIELYDEIIVEGTDLYDGKVLD